MTTKTPTDAEWKAALNEVEGEHRQLEGPNGRWCYLCDAVECSIVPAIATLSAALDSLAAKDAEIERLRDALPGPDAMGGPSSLYRAEADRREGGR